MVLNKSNFNEKDVKVIVDMRGLNWPLPLLRIKKDLAQLSSGEILQANGTDSGCRTDLPSWCSRIGHTYLGEKIQSEYVSYYIQKK